ncbi:hypothetical protein ACM66B_001931 [Microbotryomycetes sp. NB124-2]
MPLDSNLYTLSVQSRKDDPSAIDFVEEPSKEPRYTAFREPSSVVLRDAWTDTTLAKLVVTGQKSRVVNLLDPESTVDFNNPGSFSWQWLFEWEQVRYKWERNSRDLIGSQRCYSLSVSMKPDPDFPICQFEPAQKRKPPTIQFLDYNLQRVEPVPQDRKGLEVVTLVSLVGFVELLFGEATPPLPVVSAVEVATRTELPDTRTVESPPTAASEPATSEVKPRVSSKPSKTLSQNEIEVTDPSKRDEDLKQCLNLLKDDKILWIVLIGNRKDVVPYVAALAERVKTQRYKASGEELKQYIDDDSKDTSQRYATPDFIRIYLSRIELAELLPNYKRQVKPRPAVRPPINFDEPPPPPARLFNGQVTEQQRPSHVGSSQTAAIGPAKAQTGEDKPSNWFGWSRR